MLLPVGLDSRKFKCQLVTDSDGIGFWLLARNKRVFGEARLLNDHKEALQKFELNSTWLALEIVDANYQALEKLILDENPTKLEFAEFEKVKIDKELMRLEVEFFVRNAIRNLSGLTNPVFFKYRERINALLTGNKVFEYQQYMAYVAVKNRYIKPEDVENIKDIHGEIDAVKVANNQVQVGIPHLQIEDFINGVYSEELIYQLWSFANAENNQVNTEKTINENNDIEESEAGNESTSETLSMS